MEDNSSDGNVGNVDWTDYILNQHIDINIELREQVCGLQYEINSLESELSDLRDYIIDLEGENGALEEEIERLRWMAEIQD